MTPAVLGGLVPDAIDKTLAWVLGVVPVARHIGHTPFAACLLTASAWALFGRSNGTAFGAAYLVHLVGDLWHDGHVPWLMPFKRYHERSPRWTLRSSRETLFLEIVGAIIIALLFKPTRLTRP